MGSRSSPASRSASVRRSSASASLTVKALTTGARAQRAPGALPERCEELTAPPSVVR
jgi:hypothetical protein